MTKVWASPSLSPGSGTAPRRPGPALVLGGGFFYWLTFLLVLEPGNIFGAARSGGLDFGHEALRMTGAATIGALTTPLLIALVRRHPVMGARRWTNLARLAASDVVLACGLVTIACLLARPLLHDDQRPILVALWHELLSNGPLVGFSIAAFLAFAHLIGGPLGLADERTEAPVETFISSVLVTDRDPGKLSRPAWSRVRLAFERDVRPP